MYSYFMLSRLFIFILTTLINHRFWKKSQLWLEEIYSQTEEMGDVPINVIISLFLSMTEGGIDQSSQSGQSISHSRVLRQSSLISTTVRWQAESTPCVPHGLRGWDVDAGCSKSRWGFKWSVCCRCDSHRGRPRSEICHGFVWRIGQCAASPPPNSWIMIKLIPSLVWMNEQEKKIHYLLWFIKSYPI